MNALVSLFFKLERIVRDDVMKHLRFQNRTTATDPKEMRKLGEVTELLLIKYIDGLSLSFCKGIQILM